MSPHTSLPALLARIRSQRPDLYRDLFSRYSEAILAIEQDDVTSIEDVVDTDVEEELFDLLQELRRLDLTPP